MQFNGELMNLLNKLKRREFLRRVLTLIGGGVILNLLPSFLKKGIAQKIKRSKLVTVYHHLASDGTGGKDNSNLNDEVIKYMINEGVKAFTGKDNVNEAWSVIIPDISKRVAIKINCQITGIYTKAKVVKPLIDSLIQLGVKPENIIVYDMTDKAFSYAGFIKNQGPGVKVGTVDDYGGYHRFFYNRLTKILTGGLLHSDNKYYCDYLINVPVLKALDGYSGVTLSMKNHYGSIGNPGSHHDDMMTYLPELNGLPYIRDKTQLIVMDAVFVEYKWINGRDQKHIDSLNKIMISDDPVAIDNAGWKLIDEKRKQHGLNPVLPEPVYIQRAAKMGLGTDKPELVDLDLGA